ncbi:MAG: FHA domain-containing protein [Oscillospiraceae bacterium]|nr:FHA domain-containing protein [Oscillospiraceae bacterium]
MKIIKCKKDGHVYNRDKFDKCPVCGTPWDESKIPAPTDGSGESTMPGNGVKIAQVSEKANSRPMPVLNQLVDDFTEYKADSSVREAQDGNETAETENILTPVHSSAFSPKASFPIAILVAVQGIHKGEIYEICRGQNTLGRGEDMNIRLEKDETVSRNIHCIMIVEDNDKCFVKSGQSRGMTYLNDKVVFATTELQDRDVIAVGKTKLMLIMICRDGFSWISDGE